MIQPSPENDLCRLLLPGEEILRDSFVDYFLRKRHNFISSVNTFPDLADLFLHIDKEWLHYVTILGIETKDDWIVPIQLTVFCLRGLRLSFELLCAGCTTPGFSHLRSAVESFVQAQKIMREPALGLVWLRKEDDRKEYDTHFKNFFKANLFPEEFGLAGMHDVWKMLCDVGPHPNVNAIGVSSSITESDTTMIWTLQFFESSKEELSKNILFMLRCSVDMLKHTYRAFHSQLSLYDDLLPRLHSHLARFAYLNSQYTALFVVDPSAESD